MTDYITDYHNFCKKNDEKLDASSTRPFSADRTQRILKLWQDAYPDAGLIPGTKVPLLTHTMGGPPMRTNNIISLSALANNALYSWEVGKTPEGEGRLLNFYETMIPDLPSHDGTTDSTTELYVHLLGIAGMKVTKYQRNEPRGQDYAKDDCNYPQRLRVGGVHFHWWASSIYSNDRGVPAIHHQGENISPEEFSRLTIRALQITMAVVERRGIPYDDVSTGPEYGNTM